MALPLFWPGRYLFYPIGNTSAITFTRDLAPETDGNILLLGCGDPRNILYTIFCEPEHLNRTLDFTCCDMDPAVLARNVILLTLVADNQTSPAIVWNIFFHMRLDAASLAVLVSHCRKLLDISATLKQWRSSAYSHFIRMCTEYTLSELRRHWSLYEAMPNLPSQRTSAIESKFSERSRYAGTPEVSEASTMSSARSAGPLITRALEVCAKQFEKYWKAGGSFTSVDEARESKLLNPTFVYSLGGEGCSVHYSSDPIHSFHLASVLGNGKREPTVNDIVAAAKTEFEGWCSSFHKSVVASAPTRTIPTIRFFVGEATAVCHSLRTYATTGALTARIPVAKWNAHLISLDQSEYLAGGAPTTFNVIDTSNLDDHIGFLNVIIASVPLLPVPLQPFVLYTESLLFRNRDATKEFAECLHTELSTFGHLVGICPVDYLAGFSSRSNVHELIVHRAQRQETNQFHRVTTWKSPSSANDFGPYDEEKQLLPIFDSEQLGTRLYDMYQQLFEKEKPSYFAQLDPKDLRRAVSASNLVNEVRETFVLFLKLVRDRLEIPEPRWSATMERFLTLFEQEREDPEDRFHRYDFYTCCHLHGVHTHKIFNFDVPKVGPMVEWDRIPSLVRIILIVPRAKLGLLENNSESIGTPLLQCEFKGTGRRTQDIFTSVHAAYGTTIPAGSRAHPRVVFNEDPKGRAGTSPLIATFIVPTQLLTVDTIDKIQVSFAMRGTAGVSWELTKKLGSEFPLFTADLIDNTHVYVLPEEPFPAARPQDLRPSVASRPGRTTPKIPQIGSAGPLMVEMDEECELISRLICRISVESQGAKHCFGSGANPRISQTSACIMELSIGNNTQILKFPFPIIGSQNVLRLARKSLYIEIVVPISGAFRSDGMKLNPFPVVGENLAFAPWSLHRLNLPSLPILDTGASDVQKWLKPHLAWMLSARERKLTKTHENDALALVKDTIHTIFHHASGISGGPLRRVFALRDKPSTECDTIIFISDVKYDLASHTMICDGYVLPLTPARMSTIRGEFGKLIQEGNIFNVGVYGNEMRAWKQLLPAFAERCRSWKHTNHCEYAAQTKVPLSDDMHFDPLCSCGRGKNSEGMKKVELWSKFAPLVTQIAMSPLFAVSYLEPVARDLEAGKCCVCRGRGKPKMMKCSRCQKVRYCSKDCQRKNWESHKAKCKTI
ncbi:hypothetical protein B0H17DRAFT_1004789 [Mycena rosella]|uniref:MYND-type domain-containing protein n=1 Tax=Mycena rosella TaxID=1033263 RepID=A0AAD7GR46_MYCRO|nr:hypothetical protein B0H17DRAFT_1004789 [Mycena rosella]